MIPIVGNVDKLDTNSEMQCDIGTIRSHRILQLYYINILHYLNKDQFELIM